jgi:hypothetical protein
MRPARFLALLVLAPLSAFAADPAAARKEALIDRLEAMNYGDVKFSADSPLIGMLLQDAKRANPNASAETWKAVSEEVSTSYLELLTRKGGAIDQLLRPSLESLTERELNHLASLLADPVFQKYKSTMQSPQTQLAMQKAMMAAGLELAPMLNSILEKHALVGSH